jgi:hypothetical protein
MGNARPAGKPYWQQSSGCEVLDFPAGQHQPPLYLPVLGYYPPPGLQGQLVLVKSFNRINCLVWLLLCGAYPNPASSQSIGMGTSNPNPSAALDVSSANKGLRMHRVMLGQPDDNTSPIPNPAVGLHQHHNFAFACGNNFNQSATSTVIDSTG